MLSRDSLTLFKMSNSADMAQHIRDGGDRVSVNQGHCGGGIPSDNRLLQNPDFNGVQKIEEKVRGVSRCLCRVPIRQKPGIVLLSDASCRQIPF